VNHAGVRYYKNLITALKSNGIEPFVTLYHWDLPQPLQDIGGWPNEALVDYFADYARLAFKLFGNDVKNWMTFNEAKQICQYGYGYGSFAPGMVSTMVSTTICTGTLFSSPMPKRTTFTTKNLERHKMVEFRWLWILIGSNLAVTATKTKRPPIGKCSST
jgi:hypothetical protein